MQKFAASSVQRGCYIDLDGGLAFADAPYVQIASRDVSAISWRKPRSGPITFPPLVVTTYRIKRQCEGRLFYEGRNRRIRELPAKLEVTP